MEQSFLTLAEGFDLPILQWIAAHIRCTFLDVFMPAVTVLGNSGIFWIILAVLFLCIPKYRKMGLGMGAALLLGLVFCNLILKPLCARIRPYDLMELNGSVIDLLIAAPHDFSFPSGHTAASFEAATVMFLHNKKLGVPALILACLIAFSRLYLYVHYPTDVIFGLILGVALGFLGKFLVGKGCSLYEAKKAAK